MLTVNIEIDSKTNDKYFIVDRKLMYNFTINIFVCRLLDFWFCLFF
jgi:hypothetical protein